jgi:hypothetical protein
MNNLKTIELLKKKILREQSTRKAAEQLLEQKSTELFYAKQQLEDSLEVVTEKAAQDEKLIEFKNELETILLTYSALFLQSVPDDSLVQKLLRDLSYVKSIKLVYFFCSLKLLSNQFLQAGESCRFDECTPTDQDFLWLGENTQLAIRITVDKKKVGVMHFIFQRTPDKRWLSTIEKQCCLIVEMISIAFHRQLLLNTTIEEKLRAEKSDRLTRDFVAMINHELRTPLNGLLGAAELIEETSITPYQQKLLTTVHEAGDMLRVIINDLLDISKINAGMLELKLASFSPKLLIDTINQIFSAQIKDKGLFFKCEIDKDLPELLQGDADRIKQILVNLIGNSVKFTSEGGITFSVSWKKGSIVVFIKDTGCGIPHDKQATLFDPFTQVDNSSQRKFEGTGLGLSICKMLVEIMGGKLSFTSKLSEGTQFEITMPLEKIEPKEEKLNANSNKQVTDFSIAELTILAAEDIKINQTILSMMLKKMSIEHKFADNGQEAIDCLQENPFDIILMDCRMPVLDGYKATKHLRKQGYKKPIIALTAGTTSMEIDEAMDCGMDDILHKPYKREELEAMLKKWGRKLSVH